MSKKRAALMAVIGISLFVGSVLTVSATQTSRRRRTPAGPDGRNQQVPYPTTTGSSSSTEPIPSPRAEFWAMTHDPAKTYAVISSPIPGAEPETPEQDRIFRDAAEAFRRARPIPDERLRFFGWLERPDSPLVRYGWNVCVRSVTPAPGGWLATVRVSARALRQGSHAHVYNCMDEDYLLSDGDIRFLGARPVTSEEPSFGW